MAKSLDAAAKIGIDAYSYRARLQPALLVALPIALCVLALDPSRMLIGTAAWAVAAWAGGALLLAQLGRDMGRRREPELFAAWGGKPTTRMLRHSGAENPSTTARRHRILEARMNDVRIPTREEEERDPQEADHVYDTCATYLRSATRDRTRFPLLFDANCDYGFRRNAWGMKPYGIVASIGGAGVSVFVVLMGIATGSSSRLVTGLSTGAISVALLLVWSLVVKPSWVRITAEAYSLRLLESCDNLGS